MFMYFPRVFATNDASFDAAFPSWNQVANWREFGASYAPLSRKWILFGPT
jgi:hypothetical protein